METAPLKPFATWARTALISEVTARIAAVLAPGSSKRVEQARAIAALEKAVTSAGGGDKGRAAVADKVAYIWFNRIVALRFMDANSYTGIGVVSPQAGVEVGQPEILAEAKKGVIDTEVVRQTTRTAVAGLLDGTRSSSDPQGEAYALLLAEYCRHWNRAMPFMFEREGDFTELLIPANLLADGSVLNRSVKVLTEDVCNDVEVIGWLYQFYISERKDEVFAGFKKNKKAGADEIPAATQLFTPHWIVRYLVENSLGRLWMLNRPSSGLITRMDYYIAPLEEETDFLKISKPEELKVIDPACGSGHMLTYAFDLLYAIYEEEGYAPADIPSLILTNNLYGTEIDPRAGALAAFALTMKARARHRASFSSGVQPNICVLRPIQFTREELDLLATRDLEDDAFWNSFEDTEILGSLIKPQENLIQELVEHLLTIDLPSNLLSASLLDRANLAIHQSLYLSARYSVVIINPPYLSDKSYSQRLKERIKRDFPETRHNLYSVFVDRALGLLVAEGFAGMVTLHSWMSGSKYQKFRERLLSTSPVVTMAHLGSGAFDSIGGQVVASTAFVLRKHGRKDTAGVYLDLTTPHGERAKAVLAREAAQDPDLDCRYLADSATFMKVPGSPIVYTISRPQLGAFLPGKFLDSSADFRQGMATTDNNRFLRRWCELSFDKISMGSKSSMDETSKGSKWFPYNKGGGDRRWYGHNDFVVDYEDNGDTLIELVREKYPRISDPEFVIKNRDYYFKPSVTYSALSDGAFAARLCGEGFIFDTKGSCAFPRGSSSREEIACLLNSCAVAKFLELLAPTLDFSLSALKGIPLPVSVPNNVEEIARKALSIASSDWDSSEMSWDFQGPFVLHSDFDQLSLEAAYAQLRQYWQSKTLAMQRIEEENNRGFIEAYGLQDELEPQVPLENITLLNNPKYRFGEGKTDSELQTLTLAANLRELTSFAVGCMFGRYSIDEPGLILANQGDTLQDFLAKVPTSSFAPDSDNVIPIVEGDWFEDDIVERFRQFLRVAFGEEHLEDNLRFVTRSLGVKNLRDYFVKSFYKDHVQGYNKRPIYWLFSSPKGSFNALIYMHRYTPSTVSIVLNEYLREFQAKLRASLEHAERSNNAKEADRLRKVLLELDEYEHDVLYPLASQSIAIDLDDGVKENYPKFGAALKPIPGVST